MAPKKDKGKNEGDRVGIFSEVERTLLQQQVTECNRRIARLKSAVEEYETRNEELQKAYDKLDEDRTDIIAFLKKQYHVKNEEYNELKEKLDNVTELKETERVQFHETVTQLEKNFTTMKDQLTSENKLLTGKLNTLEEFRAVRDDLMLKFEKQEAEFEDQEMKYKRIIYDAEKKFVIGKDKLKKEMEARLLQLAQDFQDSTELRIAASTHRVIRENIAINNELDNILSTQQTICDQNETFKESFRTATIARELAEQERDTAINKSIVQRKVIQQLTAAFENIKKEKGLREKRNYDFENMQAKIHKLTKEKDNLTLQVRILEQNLHAKLCDQNKVTADACNIRRERDKLQKILHEVDYAIKATLKLDQWAHSDPELQTMDKKLLLTHLLQIVSQFHEMQRSESLATITSFSKVYDQGDLGIVPKLQAKQMQTKKDSVHSAVSVTQQIQKQRPESIRGDITKSGTASSLSTPSIGSSIKTIPSIQILPELSVAAIPEAKLSVESFVTSTQSTASDEQESEQESDSKTDIEKKLLASKLEIQKSILKDLAFSQMAFKKSNQSLPPSRSQSIVLQKISSTMATRKSVTIMDSVQKLEAVNLPEHDSSDTDDATKEKMAVEEIDLKSIPLPEPGETK